jgi:hypothetical protein
VEHFKGFPVETGTACLVDEGALAYGMPPDSSLWRAHIFARIDGDHLDHSRWMFEKWKSIDENRYKSLPGEYLAGYSLPEEERWEYRQSKSDLPGVAVNIPLPLAQDGANIIIFSSGMGDGSYPLVAGYDAAGELTAIHIDFAGPAEFDDVEE